MKSFAIVCILRNLNGKDSSLSTVAVLKWIRAVALEVKTVNAVASFDIVMIDEVWHFVNGKKQDIDLESG